MTLLQLKRYVESHGCKCEIMPSDYLLCIDEDGQRAILHAELSVIKQWLGY